MVFLHAISESHNHWSFLRPPTIFDIIDESDGMKEMNFLWQQSKGFCYLRCINFSTREGIGILPGENRAAKIINCSPLLRVTLLPYGQQNIQSQGTLSTLCYKIETNFLIHRKVTIAVHIDLFQRDETIDERRNRWLIAHYGSEYCLHDCLKAFLWPSTSHGFSKPSMLFNKLSTRTLSLQIKVTYVSFICAPFLTSGFSQILCFV